MNEFCKTTLLPLNQTVPLLHYINVNVTLLANVCREVETLESDSAIQAKYSEPMVLIGYYIACATNYCYVAMAYDLRKNKFWIPCKHMSLNAAFITIIAVAIKLPMDLSSPMPNNLDQIAKLGSLGFLCVVLCHIMPSLGSMNTKSLISNVTALSILVITLIVNVGIQLKTGVISNGFPFMIMACIYMGMLFFLLILFVASSITNPTFKRVLELKYQANLTDVNTISTVEELRKLVKRYWIMAETGNPQFVIASTPLSSASSMICAISMLMHLFLISFLNNTASSVYGDSAVNNIIVWQTIGIGVGFITSIRRCYTVLKFKLLANQNRNNFSVFKVEKYWTPTRYELKQSNLNFLIDGISFRGRKFIQIIWTGFDKLVVVQTLKVVVVSCKIIELVPLMAIIFAKCISQYFKLLKQMLFTLPTALRSEDIDQEHINYVMLLEDDEQLAKHLLKRSIESMAKEYHRIPIPQNNLLKLLEISIAFDGVEYFDTDQIQPLLPIELVNSWSLPVISLTCIAIAIPSIDKDLVDNLVKSVGEGLFFTRIVEESLNKESEYVNIQRATMSLWFKVEDKREWCDTTLQTSAYSGKTPTEIIKSFAYSAEVILKGFIRSTNGELLETEILPSKVIVANSMYRCAKTIIYTYESNNLEITEDELFSRLSTMIADILAACFTNLSRLIRMKCHESRIEKREASVRAAVILFNHASKIIEELEIHALPNMNPDKMAYIDEWRLYFKQL